MSLHGLGYDVGLPLLAKHSTSLRIVRSSSYRVDLVDNYEIVRDERGRYRTSRLTTTKGVCLTTTSWDTMTTRFL